MEIIIHQALYGDSIGAWELLKTTLPDSITTKKIGFHTDLQDRPATGITWEPVIRGFAVNEFFLIMKTYPDFSPGIRKGRVFSHFLIISLNDLKDIRNIYELVSSFPNAINKSIELHPIIYKISENNSFVINDDLQSRFNKVIHGFTKLSEYKNVIVWIGQEEFEQALCSLWQILSEDDKLKFNFGINFNPNQIPLDKINFITTPESCENKFFNTAFCVVRKNDTYNLTEFFELYLASNKKAKERIDSFIKAIEAKNLDANEISILAKGINTYENLDSIDDFKLINTLSHIVAEYSPDELKGIDIKKQILHRIQTLSYLADVKEICLLKNFKTNSFNNSGKLLTIVVSDWIDKFLFTETENKKNDLLPILKLYFKQETIDWWTECIRIKLIHFLKNIDIVKARLVWDWLLKDFDILINIEPEIDVSKDTENNFVKEFPNNINKSNFNILKKFARKRNWYKLHGKILSIEYSFEKALSEQLKIDIDINYTDGIEPIISDIKPSEIVHFAVNNGDQRLINISGRFCAADISLLKDINIEIENWQKIWLVSIQNGNSIKVDDNALQTIYKLFDILIEEKPVDEKLLSIISESIYANLLDYPQREKLWNYLPIAIKDAFLKKTSTALLESVSQDADFEVPSDTTLANYIISSNSIGEFLYHNRDKIKNALPIFIAFVHLPEYMLRDYIANYIGTIDLIEAKQLGQLIKNRNYSQVAKIIYNKSYDNSSFKVALIECQNLLNVFTHLKIAMTNHLLGVIVTEDKWWEAFKEIAIKLYGGGPTDKKIWVQAEGEESELLFRGSGKEAWIDALENLRNGGCEGITVEKLLMRMSKEYKKNKNLKMLIELKDSI